MADITHGGTPVVGDTAHDAVDSGRPVKIGGRASTDEPTAVAVADRVEAWFDTHGRLVIINDHANPETPITIAATASGTTEVIAAPGAGVSLYIVEANIMNGGTSKIDVSLRDGVTDRWRGDLAADGGGANQPFHGWKLTANTALNVALFAAGDIRVNVLKYYIAP